jgi:hypothetical protein
MKGVILAVDCLVLWKQTAEMSTNSAFAAVSRGELPVKMLSIWGSVTMYVKQQRDAVCGVRLLRKLQTILEGLGM